MEPGTRVEVRSRFDNRWSRGFEVAEVIDEADGPVYKIRRRSDGSVLPTTFAGNEVREDRRRAETWWIN